MIGIVVSRADRASEHVGEHLLSVAAWTEREDADRADADGGGTYYRREGAELRTFEELHIYLDDPAAAFASDLDVLVVASRHAGDTGPLLTAHFTGNFGPAEYGGEAGQFARAAPNAQKRAVEALSRHAPEGYEVGVECTHHGPTAVDVPSMFVELGSGEDQWDDPAGAEAVARAILDLEGVDPDVRGDAVADRATGATSASDGAGGASAREGAGDAPNRQVVGFGGGHYAPRFERIVRETPWAVGHVAADWCLEDMGVPAANLDVLERAFRASAAEYAVLEADRPHLEAAIEELGYRAVSETWVREVGDAPLALVEALEERLSTVDEGLRFGAQVDRVAGGDPTGVEIVALPDDLLAAAQGIDAGATREAVAGATVAFETEEGGTRARGSAAVVDPAARADLLEALAAVLESEYDEVEHVDGAVVARKTAFDPEKARTLGVPEGPKFGTLSAGRSVEVDGREIDPEAVQRERVDRFEV